MSLQTRTARPSVAYFTREDDEFDDSENDFDGDDDGEDDEDE
jgi:hypothetical protein